MLIKDKDKKSVPHILNETRDFLCINDRHQVRE